MSEVSKTVKYSAIYAIGVFLNRGVSFILLPVYTRLLTPEDYGTIEMLTMTVDIFAMIAGMGLTAAVFRFYYQYNLDKDRNKVISTITTMYIGLYFLGGVIGFSLSEQIASLILSPTIENKKFVELIFIIFFLQAFIEIPLIFIKAQQRPLLFVGVSIFKLITQVFLNIILVVWLRLGVIGVLYSTLATSMIFGFGLIFYTFHVVGFHFSKKLAKNLLIYGAPFILSNIADFIVTFSDRYFLRWFADLSEVGIYSLGYKLGFVLWVSVVGPIFNIWGPQRFSIIKESDANAIIQRVFILFNIAMISTALLLALFAYDLFRIMSASAFWPAYRIVPLIMIAYILQGWTLFGNFGSHFTGKTKNIAFGSTVAAGLIIPLNFCLIPKYQGVGAAIATVIAFGVRFIIIYRLSQKEFRQLLPWKKLYIILLIASISYYVSVLFKQQDILISLGVNSVLFTIYIVVLVLSPVLDREDWKTAFQLFLRKLKAINIRKLNA